MDKKRVIERDYPDEHDLLRQIIDFCYGCDICINPGNCDLCYLIASDLGIRELMEPAAECMSSSFNIATVVGSLLFQYRYHGSLNEHLRFIWSHFAEMMYNDDVMTLPYPVLEQLLQGDDICVDNEDKLAFWVSKIIQDRGKEFAGLTDRLYLGDVSNEAIIDLCSREEIDAHELLKRARKEQANPTGRRSFGETEHLENVPEGETVLIEYNPEDKTVNGIINYIKSHETPGVSEIDVRVSSTHYKYFVRQNLLDLANEHRCWYSNGNPDQWIIYNFSPRRIKPNRYTLRTSGADRGHLRSWTLEASNDGKTWILLHKKDDVDKLDGPYKAHTFKCHCDDYYRMVKLKQTGRNSRGDYSMTLSCCEFFGRITSKTIR